MFSYAVVFSFMFAVIGNFFSFMDGVVTHNFRFRLEKPAKRNSTGNNRKSTACGIRKNERDLHH